MTPKQERFVEEYLIDLNATQAAIRAGYSAKTAEQQGPRLLGNVGVQRAIQAAKSARAESTGLTARKVLDDIETIKRACMATVKDQLGNVTMADPKAALKAAELEGKHLGIWVEKTEISGPGGAPVQIDVSGMSADAMRELVEARRRAASRG